MTRLREVMDERELTAAAIAADTGLDPKTVWHASVGKKTQRATKISIARVLGMNVDDLFPPSNIQISISKESVST